MCAEIDLFFTQHLHMHIEALRCERVDIVRLVQFGRVVNARFKQLPHRLVIRLCEPVDLSGLRCSHPLEPPIGIGWLIAHPYRLSH